MGVLRFMRSDAQRLGLKFEREFFQSAANFLRCRLLVMGGKAEGDCGGGLEGALLGMLDWKGELGIMCQEARNQQRHAGHRRGQGAIAGV